MTKSKLLVGLTALSICITSANANAYDSRNDAAMIRLAAIMMGGAGMSAAYNNTQTPVKINSPVAIATNAQPQAIASSFIIDH